MSIRTASLLFLFVSALLIAGPLAGLMLRLADGSGAAGPWLALALAASCVSLTMFLGRKYILPIEMADSSMALPVVVLAAGATLAVALVAAWILWTLIGPRLPYGATRLGMWFAGLWLVVDTLHRGREQGRLRVK